MLGLQQLIILHALGTLINYLCAHCCKPVVYEKLNPTSLPLLHHQYPTSNLSVVKLRPPPTTSRSKTRRPIVCPHVHPTSPTAKFQLSNIYATAPCPSSPTMHPKASLQAPFAHDQPPFPHNAKHNGPCPPKTAYNQHSPNMGQNPANINMPTYNQHSANSSQNLANLPPRYRPPRQVKPSYAQDMLNIGP